ncbi:MAG: tRNA (adenosine(37)-N6)-threonylcarbamoyltransferase complex dimerization subunit type 1 TsaB, partial [Lachnospiraceae bacterium]|nr:tRNA (adenosine(37)-N6)-threonylcarbamoyltransferase complex dimerization subunit type 1 TsaB [Lachnospiraceae bacterium]
MKILAIDTSGQVAGCALLEDGRLLSEYNSLSSASALRKTHSQTLMPMLESLRDQTELDLHTLDAIAVTAGPGSFTGLRIGAATAKGLGLALEKPVIAVPTLEALAFGVWTAGGDSALICPVMDARRRQVYTAAYAWRR